MDLQKKKFQVTKFGQKKKLLDFSPFFKVSILIELDQMGQSDLVFLHVFLNSELEMQN